MSVLSRRQFLHTTGIAAAAVATGSAAGATGRAAGATGRAAGASGRAADAGAVASPPPQTGFEQRNGASWTTHDEELAFLEAVAAGSDRVRITEIGRTNQNRPLHLVAVTTTPEFFDPIAAQQAPLTLFIGSQHGNEPAGRETCLGLLRDLAFTDDTTLLRQLAEQIVLFIPSANPDGRARNTRGNAAGVDINRDHLNLAQRETRAMHAVIRDWNPDLVLDLHEYGPSLPVLYDDEILYLWPRNLNVDASVRDLSRTCCKEYVHKGAVGAGYTADEYGLQKAGPIEVAQTAGNEDEGICRNAMGLRHALGILIESAVTADARNGVAEVTDAAAVNRRRVASQLQVTGDALRFMRDQGEVVKYATDTAPLRKAREGRDRSAPVYFSGADNDAPDASEMLDPPPSGYRVAAADVPRLVAAFELHGITGQAQEDGTLVVPMGQAAEPVIPLLLDGRARRAAVSATPLD